MIQKFSFGKNWQRYVKYYVNEKIINQARESLLAYIPEDFYRDKIFIDIGCGSGIFSFAALLLGCRKVYSFDIEENSVKAAKFLKKKLNHLLPDRNNRRWIIFRGNILDDDLVKNFTERGDIIYSWGVLHHTGNMWKAILNALSLVKTNGIFVVSIYNRAPSSSFWLRVKKFYNHSNALIKSLLVLTLFIETVLRRIMLRKHPLECERGMRTFTDVIDWLGGYPYEFASFDEVKNFVENLGCQLIKTPREIIPSPPARNFLDKIRRNYTGCNEFVFKKIK